MQGAVEKLWASVTSENLYEVSDFKGYKDEFLHLFGFGFDNVDYDADVNPDVRIAGMVP